MDSYTIEKYNNIIISINRIYNNKILIDELLKHENDSLDNLERIKLINDWIGSSLSGIFVNLTKIIDWEYSEKELWDVNDTSKFFVQGDIGVDYIQEKYGLSKSEKKHVILNKLNAFADFFVKFNNTADKVTLKTELYSSLNEICNFKEYLDLRPLINLKNKLDDNYDSDLPWVDFIEYSKTNENMILVFITNIIDRYSI